MVMNSRRRLEGRLAATSSRRAKLHTDARHVVRMTPVYSAVDAMIPRIIQGIWFMLVSLWAIVDAVIVVTQRHGDFQFTALYIPPMKMELKAKERERR